MKTSSFVLIGLVAVAVLAYSCSRENGYLHQAPPAKPVVTPPPPPPPDSTYGGKATNNYQPDSVGDTWNYQVHAIFNIESSEVAPLDPPAVTAYHQYDLDTTGTYHVTALGTTFQANGLTFYNYSNDAPGGNYKPAIANSNGSYTGHNEFWSVLWAGGANFAGFSLNVDTVLYLKVGAKGTTWNQTTMVLDSYGFLDTTIYNFTIIDTGLVKAVGSINYPHTIHVESKVLPGAFAPYAALYSAAGLDLNITTEFYFAENVGLIEEDLSEPFIGITVTATLVSSTIK